MRFASESTWRNRGEKVLATAIFLYKGGVVIAGGAISVLRKHSATLDGGSAKTPTFKSQTSTESQSSILISVTETVKDWDLAFEVWDLEFIKNCTNLRRCGAQFIPAASTRSPMAIWT